MTLPGFAPHPRSDAPGDLVRPQEITCELIEGPPCRWRCEGLDNFDECYERCLADRCRDPAWWGTQAPSG
ncbi:hypothetical protein ACIBK8_09150 [Streptomyces sp. NPDC050161]|uniref:hypothetical protein n=1 Tax=Streptomyces sp. NPDC050161 TaxID=3365604 RepID=UPI00379D524E